MFPITFASAMEALVLVLALSVDSFVASFAYGASGIRIPLRSVTVINAVNTAVIAVTLFLGAIIGPYLPRNLTKYICFSMLLAIGFVKLFGGLIKLWLNRAEDVTRQVTFKLFDLRFILKIIGDSTRADQDANKVLSAVEAIPFAVALSLDGLAMGFSAGIAALNPYLIVVFTAVLGVLSVVFGSFIGRKISKKIKLDLSWVSGLILIALAVLKLV